MSGRRGGVKVDVNAIIGKARAAQKVWEEKPYRERAACLRRAVRALASDLDEVIEVIHADNGKLPMDALTAEVLPAFLAAGYYIRRGKRFLKARRVRGGNLLMFNKKSSLVHKPWGVVGIISPWNYPFSIPFSEVVMALLAGNAVLLKTASLTPRVGAFLEKIFTAAELPPGIFNYVEMAGKNAGPEFIGTVERPGVDKLFFTGSSAVGRELMALASRRLLPLVLELGGADAAIVCADADLDRAASGVVWAGFSNAGQSCGGVQRVIVHSSVYGKFLEKLCSRTEKLRIGTDLGPMASVKQKKTARGQVEECLSGGAVISAISPGAYFTDEKTPDVPALVLTNVKPDMPVMKDEVFAPVVAVVSADSDDEALAIANSSPYGLTGSVWSKNRRRARSLAARVNAGAVMINDHLMSHGLAETPWGGFGASGIGRTHGENGFMEMLKPLVVVDDTLPGVKRDLFWQPYSDRVFAGMKAITEFASGGIGRKIRAMPRLPGIFFRYWTKE
ncbi:MAG: aldehyde dehydrogenase family protein [Treponema sp.]|jgi:succinate-semialdehyde dehydrogenase/glutarate-semialdehyde dehydrogenase|nr:aldehyde dehydrogenase family protein [Treponema sp.]